MAKISDLKFDDKNFNKHTEYGMSLLEKSLRELGAGRSILLDKDNNIIAGNGIIEAAGSVGLEDVKIIETTGDEIVAVKRTDMTIDSREGREMALADNATANADLSWDEDNIKEQTEKWDFDTSDWGMNFDFDKDTEVEEDEAPEVNEKEPAKSELGKVYHLGEHRLMCGDSTDAGNVAVLTSNEKIEMVFTDPPYNMHYSGFGIIPENERVNTMVDFDANTISWLNKTNYGSIYIFTSKDLILDYLNIFKEWKFNILIWEKTNNPPLTMNTFLPDIEYLLYFHKGGRVWNNSLKPMEIYKKVYSSSRQEGQKNVGDLHPTMKPIDLICSKIKISSSKRGSVLDLFGGSGSTLIACEQLGRKCYMMELDPKYCDVIRKRYWKFKTGSEKGWEDGTKAE